MKRSSRFLALLLTVFLLLAGCSSDGINKVQDGRSRPSNAGQLQVIDGLLCSEKGEPVMLRGVSTHGLSIAGRFINEQLFSELSKDMGVNVFRLPLYTWGVGVVGYCTGGNQEKLKQLVIDGVNYARNQDMYAIIDWHILQDNDPNTYIEESMAFFDEMSKLFCDYNNVIYEICNEPNGVDWETIKEYANKVIPVIRENDPDSIIIVGTPEWSQRLDEVMKAPLEYDNVLYTLHFYSATHKQELREIAQRAREAGIPVFVTEYGVTASNGGMPRDLEEADVWIEFLEEQHISYCMWTFSKVPETCSAIRSDSVKYNGFTDDDITPTGKWLLETLSTHNGK